MAMLVVVAPQALKIDSTFVVPSLLAGVASGIRAVGVITTGQQLNPPQM